MFSLSFYSNKSFKSKVKPALCLVFISQVCEWVGGVFPSQQVTVGVLTLTSHCPRSTLPTTNTAFGSNSFTVSHIASVVQLLSSFLSPGIIYCDWRSVRLTSQRDQSGVYINFWMIGRAVAWTSGKDSWPSIKVYTNLLSSWKNSRSTEVNVV